MRWLLALALCVLMTGAVSGCGSSDGSISDDFDGSETFGASWSQPVIAGDRVDLAITSMQARSAPRSARATASDPPAAQHAFRTGKLSSGSSIHYEFDAAFEAVTTGYIEFQAVQFGELAAEATTVTLGVQPSADPAHPELFVVDRHFSNNVEQQPMTSLAGTIQLNKWLHVVIDAELTTAVITIDGSEVANLTISAPVSGTQAASVALGITSAGRNSNASVYFDNVSATAE